MYEHWIRTRLRAYRNAIRHHRDQRDDDRCWVDDHLLYHVVLGLPDLSELPDKAEWMRRCGLFHGRRSPGPFVAPHPPSPIHGDPDRDLETMGADTLEAMLKHLVMTVLEHHARGEQKSWSDDIALYLVLPERYTPHSKSVELANCERFYECKRAEVARGCPFRPHQW